MMQIFYNNNRVAIYKNLIFGLTVWDGEIWYPISQLNKNDLELVRSLIDNDPVFPWKEELSQIKAAEKSPFNLVIENNPSRIEVADEENDTDFMSADEISSDPVRANKYLSSREKDLKTLESSLESKEGPKFVKWKTLDSNKVLLELCDGTTKYFESEVCAKAYLLASFF